MCRGVPGSAGMPGSSPSEPTGSLGGEFLKKGDEVKMLNPYEAMAEVEELPKAVHRKDVHYPDVGSHLVAKEERVVPIRVIF